MLFTSLWISEGIQTLFIRCVYACADPAQCQLCERLYYSARLILRS